MGDSNKAADHRNTIEMNGFSKDTTTEKPKFVDHEPTPR